jgi:two-component system response regulator LytT
MLRAVVIESDSRAAQHLTALLEDNCQVEVAGTATDGDDALRLCAEAPDAAFVDVDMPGTDGGSLAEEIAELVQPPRLVFTASNPDRAMDAFRLEAVDYLLKPLDPVELGEAIDRLLKCLQPARFGAFPSTATQISALLTPNQLGFVDTAHDLLPVTGVDRDQIRLLARREIVAVLRRHRRTWIHTVLEEFATYYPLASLRRWLRGDPFIQVGRHAIVNLRAAQSVHCSDRVCRLHLQDRQGTEITTSRQGAVHLTAALKSSAKVER